MSARQTLEHESQKGVLQRLNTVSKGAHPLSVVALSCALVALLIATFALLAVTPALRLIWSAILAIVRRHPLYCTYSMLTQQDSTPISVINAIKGTHERTEYTATLAHPGDLRPVDIHISLILHTSGKARIEHGAQRVTEFIYGSNRRLLLLTNITMGPTSTCDCPLNDDIEVSIPNFWPQVSSPEEEPSVGTSNQTRPY